MIKVTNKDVISTLVVIGLDVTITKDGNEFDLELNVRYDQACNMGYTDISWEVVDGDESILEQDDMKDQLDDFVQEYVLENIGKF
jgi:hypothetical protein